MLLQIYSASFFTHWHMVADYDNNVAERICYWIETFINLFRIRTMFFFVYILQFVQFLMLQINYF